MAKAEEGHHSFKTSNRQLAFALMSAGCRLTPQKYGGPTENWYSLGFLRDRKIGTGLSMDDAVQVAIDRQIPGDVQYMFEVDETLHQCIAAWDGIVQELQDAESEQRPPNLPYIPATTVMQTICLHVNNGDSFAQLPWFNRPILTTISGKLEEVPVDGKPGTKTFFKGAGKAWSHRPSEKVKKHLGL